MPAGAGDVGVEVQAGLVDGGHTAERDGSVNEGSGVPRETGAGVPLAYGVVVITAVELPAASGVYRRSVLCHSEGRSRHLLYRRDVLKPI